MKITIYTVNDCEFSKQEKEYLTSHQLQFEEKNLELNKEFLTEMLAISDNFAGTPVTKIEKDDGQAVILKGFTREEFDESLGFKVEPAVEQKDTTVQPTPPQTNLPNDLSTTPPTPPPVSVSPVSDISGPPPSEVTPPPVAVPTPDIGTMPFTPPTVIEPPVQLSQEPPPVQTTPTPEPSVSAEPAAAAPVITPPAPVVEPPAVEPPKSVEDPKLASVLTNLQNMSGEPTVSSSPNTPTTTPAPVSGMPSVPDPNFS